MLRYSFALIRSFSNYLTLHRSDLTALAAPLGPPLRQHQESSIDDHVIHFGHYILTIGPWCTAKKSCKCDQIPEINSTHLTQQPYFGANDTAVNVSLTTLGTWDTLKIKQVCKGEDLLKNII